MYMYDKKKQKNRIYIKTKNIYIIFFKLNTCLNYNIYIYMYII